MPEAKSNKYSMKVISISFVECGSVYVWKIFQAKSPRVKPICRSLFGQIVDEIKANGLKLRSVIADGPERKFLKCMSAVNGTFGCELCNAKGKTRLGAVYYPANTARSELRTNKEVRNISMALPVMDRNFTKGVVGYTPFLDLNYFDIVWGVPTEPMHLVDLGKKSIYQK